MCAGWGRAAWRVLVQEFFFPLSYLPYTLTGITLIHDIACLSEFA